MDFIEYPKSLYSKKGETLTVTSVEHEAEARKKGWKTAAEYHGYDSEDGQGFKESMVEIPKA